MPMPAGPWIRASRPWPSKASASAPESTRTSRSRSTSSSGGEVARAPADPDCATCGLDTGGGACRVGCVQVRRLGEDLRLQRPQRRAGVDAQLVGEGGAGATERGQRVGLPVRAVQGEDEQPPAFLPQRVLGDEALDLGHEPCRLAAAEAGLEPLLPGEVAQARQPGALAVGPGLTDVVGERRTSPERQRAVEDALRVLRGLGGARLQQQPLELPRVHGVVLDPQGVAGALPGDDAAPVARAAVGLEAPAQVRDVRLQRAGRARRRRIGPELVDQPVGGHDVAAGQHQQPEHRALPRAAEVDRLAVSQRRHLAEDAESQTGADHREV